MPRPKGVEEAPSPDLIFDFLAKPEGSALAKAFMRIDDSKLRRRIVDLVEQIANSRVEETAARVTQHAHSA